MKIRLIDLLNKIYNNDNIPKKIIYDNCKWEYLSEYSDYKNEYKSYLFGYYIANYDDIHSFLNQEVEIIEEDKKIEKLNIENDSPTHFYITNEYGTKCGLTKHSKMIADKLNEIIDVVNKLVEDNEY